jgi:cytochrome c oxidase assembly protein subunit 15
VSRLPRVSPAAYRRITLLALVALTVIIVTGGAVRLTGSGLGCSDWPGCEQEQFVAPLELHPMVEFVNRIVTAVVSLAIGLAVVGSLRRDPRRRDLVLLSLGLVAGVVGQILLGALTVKFDLAPPFVMGHFLLSLALVADAVVLHERAGDPEPAAAGERPVDLVDPPLRRLTLALLPLLGVAIVAGTVVTATGPHGGDEEAPRFGFDLESVTRVHSVAVLLFLGALLAALAMASRDGAPARFQQRGRELLVVSVAQAAVGWTQWFMGVPVLLVGLHILGATLVWAAACRFVLAARARPAVAGRREVGGVLAGQAG